MGGGLCKAASELSGVLGALGSSHRSVLLSSPGISRRKGRLGRHPLGSLYLGGRPFPEALSLARAVSCDHHSNKGSWENGDTHSSSKGGTAVAVR